MSSVSALILLAALGLLLFGLSAQQVAMESVRLIAADADLAVAPFARAILGMVCAAGLLLIATIDLVLALTDTPVRFGGLL